MAIVEVVIDFDVDLLAVVGLDRRQISCRRRGWFAPIETLPYSGHPEHTLPKNPVAATRLPGLSKAFAWGIEANVVAMNPDLSSCCPVRIPARGGARWNQRGRADLRVGTIVLRRIGGQGAKYTQESKRAAVRRLWSSIGVDGGGLWALPPTTVSCRALPLLKLS